MKYMTRITKNGSRVNAVCERIIWAIKVRSEIVISDATAVSLSNSIKRLPNVGIITGIA
jgi:hypothetical protein